MIFTVRIIKKFASGGRQVFVFVLNHITLLCCVSVSAFSGCAKYFKLKNIVAFMQSRRQGIKYFHADI